MNMGLDNQLDGIERSENDFKDLSVSTLNLGTDYEFHALVMPCCDGALPPESINVAGSWKYCPCCGKDMGAFMVSGTWKH